jgi:hypothetical protein
MEESGSENLDEELAKRKNTFLKVILSITIFVMRYFMCNFEKSSRLYQHCFLGTILTILDPL